MTIGEVIESLNNGTSPQEIAQQLNIKSVNTLIEKLENAAVYLNDENNKWEYVGEVPRKSLSREITKRVQRLQEDKVYIKKELVSPVQKYLEDSELLYILFKDYKKVKWNNLNVRKTIFIEEELYSQIKVFSEENALKLNALLTVLIKKGLESYQMKIK
ncbi:hypothetical protein ACQKNC_21835 [Lysinibacillus sp. NPDC094177]|uniref:hypothetical protein n=1 Tax=Lysinibacillus sp. NPDC094177 TaxID=3390580 RepID=UPI003D08E1C9